MRLCPQRRRIGLGGKGNISCRAFRESREFREAKEFWVLHLGFLGLGLGIGVRVGG